MAVHLPVDWLVVDGFFKRERGERGVGGPGGVVDSGGGGAEGADGAAAGEEDAIEQGVGAAVTDVEAAPPLDDLTAQVAHLCRKNAHVVTALGLTS
uniref:Uncharacterized protein n=1 Tax=Oryza glumipatula TaxID=40148 RepID=A0A0E0AC40_9ORYZ